MGMPAARTDPWATAVPDWQERIRAGRSLFPDLPLHEGPARKALRNFRRLRMPDEPGMPRLGEICSDWQFDLVENLFGSFDPETRRREISEFFVLIPKKNGKTPTAAAIMLVALILNDRPDADFYLISASHHIATYSYKAARGMIKADPGLKDLFHVQDHLKKITHLTTGAQLSIISADGDIVTGSKGSGILIDEMHVLGSKPKADQIMAELRGGFAARPEGFLLTITTQSKERPTGEFRKELDRARRVRDGIERAPLLPVLYEFPPEIAAGEGWRDPATWRMVNPNLGISVAAAFLEEQFRKAEMDGPGAMATFASLHLNIEIGVGMNTDTWSGAAHWEKRARPGMTLEQLLAESEVVTIGVDWGGADDLAALAVIGRRASDKMWLHWVRAWARPTVLERRKSIVPALLDFERDGDLWIVPDPELQAQEAAQICERILEAGLLPEKNGIGLDTAGVALLMDELEARGMGEPLVTGVSQGWQLQRAVSSLPLKLEGGRMLHAAQPIMGWSVGNAKQEMRGNTYHVTKQAAGVAKIDPLMATFNAAMLMLLHPQAAGAQVSPWEDPDFRMVVA